MSVTLTLQDDLAALLQAEAEKQRQPLQDVAAALLRRVLVTPRTTPREQTAPTPFLVRPHSGALASGIQTDKLNRLADELDNDSSLIRSIR